MTRPTTLYLHAHASMEQPRAGWKIDGDSLVNTAGDRVTIRIKMHGQIVSVTRANGQHGGAFAESVEAAWRLADAKADVSKVLSTETP